MLRSHFTTLNTVWLALSTLKAKGYPAESLLAGSGIAETDLSRADIRITPNQEMRVCGNAVVMRREIGLEMGQRMHVSSYGMLGYAMLTSATVGDALRLALSYPALLGTFFELILEYDGTRIWLIARDYQENPALEIFSIELCLASLKVICGDLLGHPMPLMRARFEYDAPDYHASYAESFACPLQFGATANAFAFDKSWLDHALPLADAVTHRAMVERCRKQNTEFIGRQAWQGKIRQLLASQLCAAPGLEGMAEQMGCSARTLSRHLRYFGYSYQELLDELRFEQAKLLLAEGQQPIYRIAESLGFSETASFRHAFVRWSGMKPSQFRC